MEDTLLDLVAPAALAESFDGDGDTLVILQTGEASHGSAAIGLDGSVIYEPDPDFFGTDTVTVRLHDGRDISADLILEFAVAGTPDDPTDIDIVVNPIPENILVGTPIGTIDVIDADGGSHIIEFDDERFGHDNGQIIFIGGSGAGIDYEFEPSIPLTVSVTDSETETTIEEELLLNVTDQNDPVTAITPTTGFVDENEQGDIVIELDVHDQDAEQAHFLTVDDDRFVVVNNVLRLAPGIEVDYEADPTIVINITAKELPGGATFTEKFTVVVRDKAEQPQLLGLTNQTVLELVSGASVGNVTIDGRPVVGSYELTVDDPRFELDGTALKLKDDEHLIRFDQDEVLVEIFAHDTNGVFNPISEEFVIEVLVNSLPFHNDDNPYDVDNGGEITAGDALIIINYMADYGPGPVGDGDPRMGYDVNGDGHVTALDALLIINQLNRTPGATVGGSNGEGEQQQPTRNGLRLTQDVDASNDPSLEVNSDLPVASPLKQGDLAGDLIDTPLRVQVEIPEEIFDKQFAERVNVTLRLLSDDGAS